jgi:hypothetical protein
MKGKKAENMVQEVEHLHSKHKALNLKKFEPPQNN